MRTAIFVASTSLSPATLKNKATTQRRLAGGLRSQLSIADYLCLSVSARKALTEAINVLVQMAELYNHAEGIVVRRTSVKSAQSRDSSVGSPPIGQQQADP